MEDDSSPFGLEGFLSQMRSYECNGYSSEEDSDVLSVAEEDASRPSVSLESCRLFDRMRKSRRYIGESALLSEEEEGQDSLSEDEELGGELPLWSMPIEEESFQVAFAAHVQRKNERIQIRNRPPDTSECNGREEDDKPGPSSQERKLSPPSKHRAKRDSEGRRREKKSSKGPSIEQLNTRRRRAWLNIMKKEISKAHKARHLCQKEKLVNSKRAATQCMRFVRQQAMASQRVMKETLWRAKRLSKEMTAHWRRFDRAEKQQKRQQEKVAEEQRKMDVEFLEAKRQQRKLNFLITQTELYAHFIASKLGSAEGGAFEETILSRLDEDGYDSESAKVAAKANTMRALEAHSCRNSESAGPLSGQPSIFQGQLKGYQLKGMSWLVNLYNQGINGILADEMGLGKTVQALSLLAYIAEVYNVWGPFLVITPASTLHNWQQEVSKFLPCFKVVPYWGSPQERKVLRHFWDEKDLHTQSASFHLVVTSYQLVICDFKYFNRVKWQYLILDEAQAIKSSSSQRWKMLLEFKCRNRLLLSGTPIQNSMAELWSLLHFVMPSLFDSHQEFNDWFSKDIESTAENKSQIDEKQISRLHLILKPFMLRRIKKDVENELTDKLEVLLYCPLTIRQKLLYTALRKKVRIEELLMGSQNHSSALTSSLMNLVMQFRKVCNHPELFERRKARSPFIMASQPYLIPKLLYLFSSSQSNRRQHIFMNRFNIFHPSHVHESLMAGETSFGYLPLLGLSPKEHFAIYSSRLELWRRLTRQRRRRMLEDVCADRSFFLSECGLVFISPVVSFLAHTDATIASMPETLSHRIIRTRGGKLEEDEDVLKNLLPEFPHVRRPDIIRTCQPFLCPPFLLDVCPPMGALRRTLYASCAMRSTLRGREELMFGSRELSSLHERRCALFRPFPLGGLFASRPLAGWSKILLPTKDRLVSDAGKLTVLDSLLGRLKEGGHRVLIYSQMTRMIDLLEEYMLHKKYTFIRLDGSSKIHERRDMVADFQERADIFAFLLSTRAGGLGINLTAADTVIFYDSDWNPTVDQQAMDRAHRLGQTKQVTVYRLLCKGTIEERILQRAREKSEIMRMVIQGRPESLRPNEVVSLLLDDEEAERRLRKCEDPPPAKRRKVDEEDPQEAEEESNEEELEFLGEKLPPGSKKAAKRGGKRGRPKRGPGRPRSKAQVGHMGSNRGSRNKRALNPVDGIM